MAVPPFKVKALYDYASAEEDDLQFKSNQIITVTEEEDADWFYGEYEDEAASKHEGLFPKNFVKILEPEAPPRPARTNRSRKDHETVSDPREGTITGTDQLIPPTQESSAVDAPSQPPAESLSPTSETPQAPVSKTHLGEAHESSPTESTPAKRSTSGAAKPPPPISEKPTSNAFRDRINAFNKPAAAPVAPVKPGNLGGASGSSFIKKPFVAPPPSKNAYVPPPRDVAQPKVYRREEDPELSPPARNLDIGDAESVSRPADAADGVEDPPKPTSLKDRIALLQKQQMEQAARHAEAVSKKDKTKKPVKPQVSEQVPSDNEDDDGLHAERDAAAVENSQDVPSMRRRKSSKEAKAVGGDDPIVSRDFLSDGNDADQSGAGDTEEGEESHTGHGTIFNRPSGKLGRGGEAGSLPHEDPISPTDQARDDNDEGDEEDDDIDPEVKRRMEIRNRMAKMSGGMGMAGMFGPPGGISSKAPPKQSERKGSGRGPLAEGTEPRAAPVPILPMPGLQKVQSSDKAEQSGALGDQASVPDDEASAQSIEADSGSFSAPRRTADQQYGQVKPQDRPVPPPPVQAQLGSPNVPTPEEPLSPPLPSRPVPPPPRQIASPTEGSESDDELSSHERKPTGEKFSPSSRQGAIPSAPQVPSANARDFSEETTRSVSGIAPTTEGRRGNDARNIETPIAASAQAYAPSSRAPPPPPSAPAPRDSMSSDPPRKAGRHGEARDESDEEITEYEGDYDTDIASGAGHKDALKAHVRTPSLEDDSLAGETPLHHSGLPSIGPPVANPPRMVPPPPPTTGQAQKKRQSADMPRAAPPPPPPPKQKKHEDDEEYDPYRYNSPVHGIVNPEIDERLAARLPSVPVVEREPSSPPVAPHRRLPSIEQGRIESSGPSTLPVAASSDSPATTDIHRTSTTIRRSTDVSRPSGEHHMAADIDLSQDRGWWAQPKQPPSSVRNRKDVIYEVDENSTSRRGGKISVTKDVYILYMDYSQTVISVQFEASEPESVSKLEQKHESPPRIPRQDQLEEAHEQFGVRVAEFAKAKEGSIVGDGTSQALPLDLISMVAGALPPVGNRSYGALVYANLANATVQQNDEIRAGDIITFRNTKFGGHRGPMKSKYSHDVGKPDHVGIIVDWDGTKKKVRAWEQGRESKKVKIESFKFGDLKSGEIRVWRLMSRAWVGWDGNS